MKLDNFDAWYKEADMPMQDANGKWYDAETGIAYNDAYNYVPKKPARPVSAKTLQARADAKLFGGSALKGTRKQVAWAEKIRSEKIQHMDAPEAIINTKRAQYASFWIDNRDMKSDAIEAMLKPEAEEQAADEARYLAAVENRYADKGPLASFVQSANISIERFSAALGVTGISEARQKGLQDVVSKLQKWLAAVEKETDAVKLQKLDKKFRDISKLTNKIPQV